MQTRNLLKLALAAAVVGWPVPAAAQDSAASEALFNKGVAEMKAGRYEVACPALLESQRLEARAGTVFALAECEAKWGKLATAVSRYSDYVNLVSRMEGADEKRHRSRAKKAKAAMDELRAKVPQLTLVLPENAPSGTVVKRDGVPLSGVSLGMALPVDPGEHVLSTQVPGGPEHEQKVSIAVGETKQVVLEMELPAPVAKPAAPVAPKEPPVVVAAPPPKDRTWVYVAGGIGAAGVLVGSVTALMSMSKKSSVDDNCDGTWCNQEGYDAAESGKSLARVSTVGFGIGIAGLATGLVLHLTSKPSKPRDTSARDVRPTVFASGTQASLGLQGKW